MRVAVHPNAIVAAYNRLMQGGPPVVYVRRNNMNMAQSPAPYTGGYSRFRR